MGFLPVSKREMEELGWDAPDFVYVFGDAYIDHSSFGAAIISRVLTARGYRVAMLPQPDWKDQDSVKVFGRPKLGFLVSAGNMDSMVNHYTVSRKRRQTDAYSPGGQMGRRPDRACVVYCNQIRRAYGDVPVLLGGIEASLRRFGHYDYWADDMRRSILLDSGADILMYGMGELSVAELAGELAAGKKVSEIRNVRGTVVKRRDIDDIKNVLVLPDYDELLADRKKYAESFRIQTENTDFFTGRPLAEKYGEHRFIVQNPPQRPLTVEEMDAVYELPYMNRWHPMYDAQGGVPALSEIRFSLTSCRGCFGGCSFCALTFHQGRIIQARSHASLLREAVSMTKDPQFKGYIHDVGGPTANFRHPACKDQLSRGACRGRQCLFPKPCKNLDADHSDYVELLRKLRALPGVKKVFIRSGIRFDYLLEEHDDTFLRELCAHHISGQLRVAPEHVTDRVLSLMGKPQNAVYEEFKAKFEKINAKTGKKQYLVPYLISSHPGSTLEDAVALAESVRDMGYMPEQVQDFYPTPSTVSTVMFCTGIDPRTGKTVEVVKNPHEKAMQRALLQYRRPENHALVVEALVKAGREDLIGYGPKCLVPWREKTGSKAAKNTTKKPERVAAAAAGKKNTYDRKRKGQEADSKSGGKGRSAAGKGRKK